MNFKVRFLTVAMAALMAAVLSSAQVQAQAWEWAKRLPINQYSPEDIKILKQSMAEILGTLEDGTSGEWGNPDTGHGGSITPLTTVHQNGKLCRQTKFIGVSDGQENVSEFFLCQQPDGVWAVEQPLVQ